MKTIFFSFGHPCRALWLSCLAFLILCQVPDTAKAEVTSAINQLTVDNTADDLIVSDAQNASPGYTRDTIQVTSFVKFTRVSGTESWDYEQRYELINEAGVPVVLKVGGGTATHVKVTRLISNTTPNLEDHVTLMPDSALPAGEKHRVRLTLWRHADGNFELPFAQTSTTSSTPERVWRHFTNLFTNDPSYNVRSWIGSTTWNRPWAAYSTPQDSFQVGVSWRAARYDGFLSPPTLAAVTVRLLVEVRDTTTNQLVPLEQNTFDEILAMPSHEAPVGQPRRAYSTIENSILTVKPLAVLPAASHQYALTVRISHFNAPGAIFPTPEHSETLAARRLMNFTGTIHAAGLDGFFTSLSLPGPVAGNPVAGGLAITNLQINGQSGTLNGLPGYTFGNGAALGATMDDEGELTLTSGSIPVTVPVDAVSSLGTMRYGRRNLLLSPGGITADLVLLMPSGLCWTNDPVATRVWESELVFPGAALTAGLAPVAASPTLVKTMWANEESKPIWFKATQVTWATAQSRLTFITPNEPDNAKFVRAAELDALLANPEVAPEDKSKRSNDQIFWHVNRVNGNVLVSTDTSGTARMTAEFVIGGGITRTHFPYDSLLGWSGGQLKVSNDLVVSQQSFLTDPLDTRVPYAQDCGGEECAAGAGSTVELRFNAPAGENLRITPDGGVAMEGTLQNPTPLQWGKIPALNKFAHQASAFTNTRLHFPGSFLNGSANTPGTARPGIILHSGFNLGSGAMVRPGTTGFEGGTGEYAGLNFRTTGGDFTGTSVLSGTVTGPYDLSYRCHYVARQAGISGIHEAYTGSFPPGAVLGGYPVQFEDFGIQLIHSRVTDSRTKGSMVLQEPAGFELAYDKMFFTCLGAPSLLEISPEEQAADKVLTYWQADFRVKNASFLTMAENQCDPSQIRLAVSMETWSSEINAPLHGTLAFLPNGQIQTAADAATEPAVHSRLTLPPNLDLAGPAGERWTATTVGEAYFNHAAAAPGEVGWMNIAAKLNLPFFEDAPVHLHTRCRKNDPGALLQLMGGFQDKLLSFNIQNANYFTHEPFDTAHRGYATGVTVANYRDGFAAPDARFRMEARTRWLDVVDLNYAMAWQTGSRTFKDFRQEGTNLLIIAIDHRCRTLTPNNADLDFGAKAGTNKLSLTDLASGAVSELFDTLQGLIDEQVLTNGREAIGQLLEPTMRDLFAAPLQAKMNEKADLVMDRLFDADHWDPVTKTFTQPITKALLESILDSPDVDLTTGYQSVAGATAEAIGLLKEVKERLVKVQSHITDFRLYSQPGPGNKFDKIAITAKRVAAKISAKMDDPVYQEDIEALIEKAKPVLTQLDILAEKAQTVCATLLTALNGNGPVVTELKAALTGTVAELDSATNGVAGDLLTILKPYKGGVDDPSQGQTAEAVRQRVIQAMEDRYYSMGISANIQRILKQRLYDVEQQMRQVVDGVFEQADTAARELIGTVLGGVDKKLTEFLDGASDVMAGAEAKGKAHIRGDSLTDLRLDLIVELKASEKMKAHVFIEIKELNSENTPGGCLPPGGMGTEVTLGAKEVSLEWAYPDLTVSFDTRFQFGAEGKLSGMGGSIEVLGDIKFGGQFVISEMGCAIMFGKTENYFSAEVAMSVGKSFKAKGGVFFGRTCSLAPFFWDESIQEALGEAPFTGAYVYGEVHIALNQLIGIPSTCLFNLSVGAGTGIGYFSEGPTWIGKMFLSVEGEVLCIISVTGEISLVGVKNPQGLNLVGKGRLAAELGWCPICISVEKTATLTYKNKKWSKKVN